jgi:hypothetical protein
MRRVYQPLPPSRDGNTVTPKHKRPNCQFNELIELETGEIVRNPIGLSYSRVPITDPIVSETHLGIIEVIGLPDMHELDTPLPHHCISPKRQANRPYPSSVPCAH